MSNEDDSHSQTMIRGKNRWILPFFLHFNNLFSDFGGVTFISVGDATLLSEKRKEGTAFYYPLQVFSPSPKKLSSHHFVVIVVYFALQ